MEKITILLIPALLAVSFLRLVLIPMKILAQMLPRVWIGFHLASFFECEVQVAYILYMKE